MSSSVTATCESLRRGEGEGWGLGLGLTVGVELDRRLLDVCLHSVARVHGRLEGLHDHDGSHDLVFALVAQHGEHGNVIGLAARLLEDAAIVADDDGVGSDEEGGLAAVRIVDLAAVDFLGLCAGRLEDVVEGAEGVGEVFGKGRGHNVDVEQAQLQRVSGGRARRRAARAGPMVPEQAAACAAATLTPAPRAAAAAR